MLSLSRVIHAHASVSLILPTLLAVYLLTDIAGFGFYPNLIILLILLKLLCTAYNLPISLIVHTKISDPCVKIGK
jgi:hypothetical protein